MRSFNEDKLVETLADSGWFVTRESSNEMARLKEMLYFAQLNLWSRMIFSDPGSLTVKRKHFQDFLDISSK